MDHDVRSLCRIVPLMAALISTACGRILGFEDWTAADAGASAGVGGARDAAAETDVGGPGDAAADTAPADAAPCASCSPDLKKVVDCSGAIVRTCEKDRACSAGECVGDPCEAARGAKSSYGCDFHALNLDTIAEGAGGCFAVVIANTWEAPAHITVDRAGSALDVGQFAYVPSGMGSSISYSPYDPAGGLPPGQVAVLFLAQSPQTQQPCPSSVKTAVAGDTAVHGTGFGQAFHVATTRPVVAWQFFPYGGASHAMGSATLLLPTSAWGFNYIAVDAYARSQLSVADPGQPSLDIIASEDTVVSLVPVADIVSAGAINEVPKGQLVSYFLHRGDYVQFTQPIELTGSVVVADKPVGMLAGSTLMSVPPAVGYADAAQQMIAPIRALGREYAAVRYRGRTSHPDETVPWRIVGVVDGTELAWVPAQPQGAPSTIGQGQLAEFNTPDPFVVKSQDDGHPFYLAGYMTGGQNFDGEGDAEFVNVVPPAQFLDSYLFLTDPSFPETNLVLVRRRGTDGKFADIELDCAGVLQGWQPLGDHEFTRIDLSTGNFAGVGSCSNAVHSVRSRNPFGLTVWGWGSSKTGTSTQWASYAYPAGASFKPINDVAVPIVPK